MCLHTLTFSRRKTLAIFSQKLPKYSLVSYSSDKVTCPSVNQSQDQGGSPSLLDEANQGSSCPSVHCVLGMRSIPSTNNNGGGLAFKSSLDLLLKEKETRFPSVNQFSLSVMSDSLRPHGLQHARPPCPSPTPGVHSNPCPSSGWCHPTISSSIVPFSSCLQSFPASWSFQMS